MRNDKHKTPADMAIKDALRDSVYAEVEFSDISSSVRPFVRVADPPRYWLAR